MSFLVRKERVALATVPICKLLNSISGGFVLISLALYKFPGIISTPVIALAESISTPLLFCVVIIKLPVVPDFGGFTTFCSIKYRQWLYRQVP